jgi:hypothetical protein
MKYDIKLNDRIKVSIPGHILSEATWHSSLDKNLHFWKVTHYLGNGNELNIGVDNIKFREDEKVHRLTRDYVIGIDSDTLYEVKEANSRTRNFFGGKLKIDLDDTNSVLVATVWIADLVGGNFIFTPNFRSTDIKAREPYYV